jgi:hypothetical protein
VRWNSCSILDPKEVIEKLRIITLVLVVATLVAVTAYGPAAKRHAEAINCGNQAHVILFTACHEWANEHGGWMPTNLVSMSNELITPKLCGPAYRAGMLSGENRYWRKSFSGTTVWT